METKNNINQKTIILLFSTVIVCTVGILIFLVFNTTHPDEDLISEMHDEPTVQSPTADTAYKTTLYLEPVQKIVSVGEQFTMTLMIKLNGQSIVGTDSIVLFDPEYLEVVSIMPAPELPKTFSLLRKLVEDNTIIVSLLQTTNNIKPVEMFPGAIITFRAQKSGTTTLSFEYTPNSTTGSTMIQPNTSANILDNTRPSTVIIK